ncbi:uncharacterized protein LOC132038380 [Lycium ferocissimum]|uniref:uncharacterized protein LOC132038380 n=1 Tax=Lycium ferocissimum TaxID=112874 RepID=UPI0028151CD9|nr:uncharacterized protein LOC132038380 [Lycium ferocissimum]
MAKRFESFNTDMGLAQAQNDDSEKNVVRRSILVNLGNTFSLLPNTISASSSTQNISLTISPDPAHAYIISPQIPPRYSIKPKALQVTLRPNVQPPALEAPFTKSQQYQLAVCPYKRSRSGTNAINWDDSDRELHNLRRIAEEEMRARNIQSLRYESLCMLPNVEFPPGFKVPKFNTFNGRGNPITHLKDYCSRLMGIGQNEALRMKLFIQSLSGLALDWYTEQDFRKWYTWEDMARDFVEQFKFNIGVSPNLYDMREIERMPHESFQEYAIRWRLEASKIRPPLPENDWKASRSGHSSRKIVDTSSVQATFQVETFDNLQDKKKETDSVSVYISPAITTNQQVSRDHISFHQQGFQYQPDQTQSSLRQSEHVKFRTFTPLEESLTSIFERMKAEELLKPKKGWIPKSLPPDFDWSKSCAYHSNIPGHDTEHCPALKHKIQNMIEKNKIRVQQNKLCDNGGPPIANAIIVTGDPSRLAPRHLKRKRGTK